MANLGNTDCNSRILRIVSHGNAIITEIFRLKKCVSDVHLDPQIYNFQNLSYSDDFHQKLAQLKISTEVDENVREKYSNTISQFYSLFESVLRYVTALNQFFADLNDGIFMQINSENVFYNNDINQLMCESLYLYGVMLLLIDLYVSGSIREQFLVAHFRFRSDTDTVFDQICELFRSTGFLNGCKRRPPHYPEDYFSRIPIEENFTKMIINQLTVNDIYHQGDLIYPKPEHKTVSLSSQASMLVVCVFFDIDLLQNQNAKMREIVDRFFIDNWVVPIFMAVTVNLFDLWEPYKAARQALTNISDHVNSKMISAYFRDKLDEYQEELANLKIEESTLLPNINPLLNLCREANITLRWLILHQSSEPTLCLNKMSLKKFKIINHDLNWEHIFDFLLNLSDFEGNFKHFINQLLLHKEENWFRNRNESAELLNNLSKFFQETHAESLMKIKPNIKLSEWLNQTAMKISGLDQGEIHKSLKLLNALNHIDDLHQIDSILHLKQLLNDAKQCLINTLYLNAFSEDISVTIQTVTDMSYAWDIVDVSLKNVIRKRIKVQPDVLSKVQSVFVKLSSAMEITLMRINQAQSGSGDFKCVSNFYSGELMNSVRAVLQIIPETMFETLSKIVALKTSELHEIPDQIDCQQLKTYGQFDSRFQLAQYVSEIATYSQGVLKMNKSFVGVLCVEPKLLLEDGIRTEIVRKLITLFNDSFVYGDHSQNTFSNKLDVLTSKMDAFEKSITYIQDYMKINGLHIWLEQYSEMFKFYSEYECDRLLNRKSILNHTNIPLLLDTNSLTFLGRLSHEILRLVNYTTTIYDDVKSTWISFKTRAEVLSFDVWYTLSSALKPVGLCALDKMFSIMICKNIEQFFKIVQKDVLTDVNFIKQLENLLISIKMEDVSPVPKLVDKCCSKHWLKCRHFIFEIGTLQLLRKQISLQLNMAAKSQSSRFENLLTHINDDMLTSMRRGHQFDDQTYSLIIPFLRQVGLYDPLNTVFMLPINIKQIPYCLVLQTIGELKKMTYSFQFESLIAKRAQDQLDFIPWLIGVLTIMKQMHPEYSYDFAQFLSSLILINTNINFNNNNIAEIDSYNCLYFLEMYCSYNKMGRNELEAFIPKILLNNYHFLLKKDK